MISRRGIRPFLAAVGLWSAAANPVVAETVKIRSGEHGTFTRIVAEDGARGWSLGRAGAGSGYELRLAETTHYDLSRAFRLIGRDRIATLVPGPVPGSLLIGLACNCHATAFVTPSGALVIDVADGPPAKDSPFERSLSVGAESPLPEAGSLPQTAPGGPRALPSAAAGVPPTGSFSREFEAATSADHRLALFWRGIAMPRDTAPLRNPDAPTEPASSTGSAPQPPDAAGNASLATTGQPGDATELFRGAEHPTVDRVAQEPAVAKAPDDEATPTAAGPGLPDRRMRDAQAELLRQLGRAASQGLVEIGTDDRPVYAVEPATEASPPIATSEPPSLAPPEEQIAVHAETSIDRDMLHPAARAPVTSEGAECLPDETFDLAAWGDERPPPIQIADRRATLVREFDRPAPESVLALARLYLHFGFGAESRAVLRAFGVVPDDAAILADMGRILDGEPAGADARFAAMAGCDTAAALWAVMASPRIPPGTEIDVGAVLRTFSALPPHLRRTLGPGLSERLIAAGRIQAAASIRDAIARAPGDGGPALDLVEARVDLAAGDPQGGEGRLDALASSNDPLAPEALALAIESRLQRNEAVEPSLADSAEAMAFEQRAGENGPVLAALHILARASIGDFPRAFAALRDWPESSSPEIRGDTVVRLFRMLVDKADDRTFVTAYFRHRHVFAVATPDLLLRLDLADRLATAGFAGEVRRVLEGEPARTDRGRQILARAALVEFDPAEALERITGLKTPEAEALAAEALAMSGDHTSAASLLEALGQTERAGLEAWRGGDRTTAARFGPEPLRTALGRLGALSPTTPEGAANRGDAGNATSPGPLAAGRALVDQSRATREALGALLSVADSAMIVSHGPGS